MCIECYVDVHLNVCSYDAKLKYKMPQQEPSSKFYTNDTVQVNTTQQFGVPLSM